MKASLHFKTPRYAPSVATYFFSNSPVRWRLTKVVLPTPPSPTKISLNSGISILMEKASARRLSLSDNLRCFGFEGLRGGRWGPWRASGAAAFKSLGRVRGARAALWRPRPSGEFWASLFERRRAASRAAAAGVSAFVAATLALACASRLHAHAPHLFCVASLFFASRSNDSVA